MTPAAAAPPLRAVEAVLPTLVLKNHLRALTASFEFAAFRLLPAQRQLLRDGQPVKLGSRAFDLLLVLVQQRHRVVPKPELMDAVWPDQVVEEANLAVQVLALRKTLGREAVVTVAGRGYRFALPVVPLPVSPLPVVPLPAAPQSGPDAPGSAPLDAAVVGGPRTPTNLLAPVPPLLGREVELQALHALLDAYPQVTLVGAGGVGKTRLARQVALERLPHCPEGVWWVDLAPLSDAALVAPTVARVLRLSMDDGRDALAAVAAELRTGPALLVLDNAEHVLDGVVALLVPLRQQAPQARWLVTSQVPLGLPGEHLLHLGMLSLPADDSLAAACACGAVALFEARACAGDASFQVDARNRAKVVEICTRLDGLPLAIELAAARLPLLGLDGLCQTLGERFHVLTHHARGTLARHQTLRAALDWSHALLAAAEQRVLRRLAVFAGSFSLEAAQQLGQDGDTGPWEVLNALGVLVERSFLWVERLAAPRYRLPESTRLYALEHLRAAGEYAALQERHARTMDALMTVPREDQRRWRTPAAETATLLAEVHNLRAALDWVTHSEDDSLAVSLAAGSSHVLLAASLNAEYLQRVLPLRSRVTSSVPARLAGLFWARIALACSRNGHPAGLEAGLKAAAIYRELAEPGRLYDALTWVIAIGARCREVPDLDPLVLEAQALQQPDWPAAARSSLQWALHRWLLRQGRTAEALQCAQAQAELLAAEGCWLQHVAWGANVADCELSLGRLAFAESLSRSALQALEALGIDENLVGHVMDALMVTLTLQGRSAEAIDMARRARRLLEREGDALRLLDTLALNAAQRCNGPAAAQLAGHVDAAIARSGELRWPASAARRAELQSRLEALLDGAALQRHLATGARLSSERAFDLAFGDVEAG